MNMIILTKENFRSKIKDVYTLLQNEKQAAVLSFGNEDKEMSLKEYITSGLIDREETIGPLDPVESMALLDELKKTGK